MCAGISTGEMFINDTHYEENIHAHEEANVIIIIIHPSTQLLLL